MRMNVQRSSTVRMAAATTCAITRSGRSTARAGTDLNWTPSILTDLPAKVRRNHSIRRGSLSHDALGPDSPQSHPTMPTPTQVPPHLQCEQLAFD